MSQNFSTTSAKITDLNGNIASIDSLSSQILTSDQSCQDILQQDILIWQDIKDYLDNLCQPKTSSAASLSVSVLNNDAINTFSQDKTVTAVFTAVSSGLPSFDPLGSFFDMSVDGYSVVTVKFSNLVNQYVPYYSLDGTNWLQAPAIYVATGVKSSNGYHNNDFYILCSGYKFIRIACLTFSSISSLTLIASVSFPLNAISAFLNSTAAYNSSGDTPYITSWLMPQVLLNGQANVNCVTVANSYKGVKGIVRVSESVANTGNNLYGLTANNPHDFAIFLLLWSASSSSSSPISDFSPSIASPNISITIPPGNFTLHPNYYIMLNCSASKYLYAAFSSSATSYVAVPFGVDVTFYTAV